MTEEQIYEYLIDDEDLAYGVMKNVYNLISEYKIRVDIICIYEYKKAFPYYLVYFYNNNEETIKITKISALEPKYVYIKSLLQKPKKEIDILTDEEVDRFISFINLDDHYKQTLERFNQEYAGNNDKYFKSIKVDENLSIPDYSKLKNNKSIHINIGFHHLITKIKYKFGG